MQDGGTEIIMNIIRKITILIFLLFAASVSAAENSLDDIAIENDILGGTVKISGRADDIYEIGFCITDTFVTPLSYNEELLKSKTYAIGQTYSYAQDGGYAFSAEAAMPSDLKTGCYRAFIYADNREGAYVDFYFSNKTLSRDIFETLNTSSDLEELTAAFDLAIENLGFDDRLFIRLSDAQKKKAAELFVSNRPGGGYSALEAMRSDFGILALMTIAAGEGDEKIIDGYINEVGSEYGNISEYLQAEELIRYAVCRELQNKYLKASEYISFINNETVIKSFKLAPVWNTYAELINKHSELFRLSAEEEKMLKSISDKSSIYKDMYTARESFSILSDISDMYKRLIRKQYGEKSSSASGGGGSGGSGSGSAKGGSSVSVDIASPANDFKTEIFSDINDAEWAKGAILKLYKKNILSGRGDGRVYPNDSITREEFVAMLVRAFGLSGHCELSFADVPENAWYREFVEKAYAEKIVFGIDGERFGSGMQISRQDLAVMVYRVLLMKNAAAEKSDKAFSDDLEIAAYAREAVYNICGLGIINGMPDGSFRPTEPATRAQTAQILSKALDIIE